MDSQILDDIENIIADLQAAYDEPEDGFAILKTQVGAKLQAKVERVSDWLLQPTLPTEITPEMMEAGVAALRLNSLSRDFVIDEELLTDALHAMRVAADQPRSPPTASVQTPTVDDSRGVMVVYREGPPRRPFVKGLGGH